MSAWQENERLRPLAVEQAAQDAVKRGKEQLDAQTGNDYETKAWAAVYELHKGVDRMARLGAFRDS